MVNNKRAFFQVGLQESTIESPCIRNCCLEQDDYCLGCFRHIDEITQWRGLSIKQKEAVLAQCKRRQMRS